MVLYSTGKELDIREGKIRQKLSELACFRILLKVTCSYKCITRTWAYACETCLAIYIYACETCAVACDMRARVTPCI